MNAKTSHTPLNMNPLTVDEILFHNREDVVILPEYIAPDGTGYYSLESIESYKELRAIDLDVSYYTTKRKWIDRRSGTPPTVLDILINIGVGLASSAIYDAIKAYLQTKKKATGTVKGKIVIASKSVNSYTKQSYSLDGSIDDAIKIIDKLNGIQDDTTNQHHSS